jgi:hypothetical protein
MLTIPVLLHVIIAGFGLVLAIRRRSFAMLAVYFAAVMAIDAVGLAVLHCGSPETYRLYFLLAELAHNIALLALTVQLVADLVPERWAAPWLVFWFTLIIAGIVHYGLSTSTDGLLNVSTALSFGTAGMLLVTIVAPAVQWRRHQTLAAWGILFVLLAVAVPELPLLSGRETLKACFQWCDLPGLLLLVFSGSR